jgi:hypothetical protein
LKKVTKALCLAHEGLSGQKRWEKRGEKGKMEDWEVYITVNEIQNEVRILIFNIIFLIFPYLKVNLLH